MLYAFGQARLGLTEAEIIAAIAAEKATPVDIAPFRIERFG